MRDSHGNRLVWMAAARDRDAFARAIAESTRCRNDAEKSLFTHHRINSRPRHFSQHAGGVRSGFIHKNLYMWVTDKPALIESLFDRSRRIIDGQSIDVNVANQRKINVTGVAHSGFGV